MAKVKISRGSIYLFVVSLSRESLTLIYISILYKYYRKRRNQVNKDRNGCHTLDLWSYASAKRLVFRNIENGLNVIKAIYNYNKYNLIHTQVVVHLPSTYLTLLYPRTRNNPLPYYLLCTPR